MTDFKVGDKVQHVRGDLERGEGTVMGIDLDDVPWVVDIQWADGHRDSYIPNSLISAAVQSAPFRKGDRVEHIDYAPGFVMTVVADQYTSGAVLTEWPTGTRHTEQAKFLRHAEMDAPIDKTESICGGNIRQDDPHPVYAAKDSDVWTGPRNIIHHETRESAKADPTIHEATMSALHKRWDTDRNKSKTKTRAKTLREAGNLISGDRANDYDTKDDATGNFNRIAQLWTPILGTQVTATQVALCLTQLKVARIIVNPTKADSWIDAAGYIALGSEIAEQENK